jgi:type III pantothenate kinase
MILPGVDMMRDSLRAGTRIPPYEPEESGEDWAGDTAAAIASACIQAPAALAGHLVERSLAQTGEAAELVLTGGDAERIFPALSQPARLIPDLVLRGLALLA